MIQNKPLHTVVLGSGVAGLAAAIRMAAAGSQVTVFEKSDTYGGKLGVWQKKGFRFDTGPSLFTMPEYVMELLLIDGKKDVDFDYDQLNTICKYFWNDDTQLIAYNDREKLKSEFIEKLNESADNIDAFLDDSRQKYEITNPVFLEKSLHIWSTYMSWTTFKSFLKMGQVGVFHSMHQQNSKRFNNPKVVQFFDRYATYNGSNPYDAPATLNVIPHYEFGIGAFFPKKGMRSIVDALYQKALNLGVDFKFNTPVNQLQKRDNKYGINHDAKSYDIAICNIDVATASSGPLSHLIKNHQKYTPSSSALIFYWGINRIFKNLDLHNIFFSSDYKKEFDSIFKNHSIDDDPTVYIQISCKFKKNDAPPNKENWFVMVNAPYVKNQDWEMLITNTRRHIISKISKILKVNLEKHIELEHILTPQLIWDKTGSYKGALYGSSSNNRISAFLRQPNFSKHHKGLYFCGGSVHPGGGIPLCLLSAKTSTDIIKRDFKIC
ncbi:phytoene desaturase family protein [Bacteroidia bacterium]|nr:phytoene desaturase family protein [Bacteroidia bacterium]